MSMNPTLAVSAPDDLSTLKFPVYVGPKVDGVRALVDGGVFMSRRLKPFPNLWTQRRVSSFYSQFDMVGLDGEAIVGTDMAAQNQLCNRTSSALTTIDGEPLITWCLFDLQMPGSYERRINELLERQASGLLPPMCTVIPHVLVHDADTLTQIVMEHQVAGYEGTVVKCPNAEYKNGRATLRKQELVRIVRVERSEARIKAVLEETQNTNEKKINALGGTERSSAKAGMVPKAMVGSFTCEDIETGIEFNCGSGSLTDAQKKALWPERDSLVGKIITYEHKPVGVKVKPRFPQFVAFRDPIDM